jgi:hypothetical protein
LDSPVHSCYLVNSMLRPFVVVHIAGLSCSFGLNVASLYCSRGTLPQSELGLHLAEQWTYSHTHSCYAFLSAAKLVAAATLFTSSAGLRPCLSIILLHRCLPVCCQAYWLYPLLRLCLCSRLWDVNVPLHGRPYRRQALILF